MTETANRKYFFSALLIVAIALGIYIFRPFLTIIALSVAISVIFYPVYAWLKNFMNHDLAALLATIAFILILCVPLFFVSVSVVNQLQNIYTWLVEPGNVNAFFNKISTTFNRVLPEQIFSASDHLSNLTSQLSDNIGTIFTATLSTILSFTLLVFSMFYILRDCKKLKRALISTVPISNESTEKILDRMQVAINSIIVGRLVIAAAQGLLMGLGLFIFNVPNPALWGALTAIASLIPTVGTALVSLPVTVYLFAIGENSAGIGFLLWAALLVGAIDNWLYPVLIGRTMEIHPLLVLFAVLGGITAFGFVGIILGPLVVSFIYALSSVYKSEMN